MKPTRGRIVDYFRSTSSDVELEPHPAMIVEAMIKPPRRDLDDQPVPRDAAKEASYTCRLHVFGRSVDDKLDAEYSDAPKAGCWTWPEYVKHQTEAFDKSFDHTDENGEEDK